MSEASDKLDRHLADSIVQLRPGKPMTISGFQPGAIRAALDAAKKKSQEELQAAMNKLAEAQAKAASVPDAIHKVAAQMHKEADDALHELATFTNGPPD
jgi:hypothetical protein